MAAEKTNAQWASWGKTKREYHLRYNRAMQRTFAELKRRHPEEYEEIFREQYRIARNEPPKVRKT